VLFFLVSGLNFISAICLFFIKKDVFVRRDGERIILEKTVIEP
jgi:hypothetical protein